MIDRDQRLIAVIGAGFGDEGKGKMVSHLCSVLPNPLVVRYCGGQQAAHHVMLDENTEHVFSNFGSGTLQGCDTFWSRYCTIDPVGILSERSVLRSKISFTAKLYIDCQCPVTTPYEKAYNKKINAVSGHGSCGVGIGATHQREKDHYSLVAGDLRYPSVLKIKMDLIRNCYDILFSVYPFLSEITEKVEAQVKDFLLDCEQLTDIPEVEIVEDKGRSCLLPWTVGAHPYYVFEGSQGLLLDPKIGFFPHVTRSSTGTENILNLGGYPEIYLVTRAYQTRHGNGPMTNEDLPHKIRTNPYEKNTDTGCQGVFRRSLLDLDLLRYAISKDRYIRSSHFNLVITCMDLIEEYALTEKGQLCRYNSEGAFVKAIKSSFLNSGFHIKNVFISRKPFPEIEHCL